MRKTKFGLIAVGIALFGVSLASPAAENLKVMLCHVTTGEGLGHIIVVSPSAVPAHEGHGDKVTVGVKGATCSVVDEGSQN